MILAEAKKNSGKRVNYTGTNRPWLRGSDVFLTGAIAEPSGSIQVSYTHNGMTDTAWVGASYLELVDDFKSAIDALHAKRDSLKADLLKIETAIKTLEEL